MVYFPKKFFIVAITFILTACGGGDLSQGLNVSNTSLAFSGPMGNIAPQSVTAQYASTTTGSFYLGHVNNSPTLVTVISTVSGTQATLNIRPLTNLARGNYSGSVLIYGCPFIACASPNSALSENKKTVYFSINVQ